MKATFRIFIAILLGLLVLVLSGIVSSIDVLVQLRKAQPWVPITHTVMLLASFILIYLLSKGKISLYGIKMIRTRQLKQPIIIGTIAAIIVQGLGLLLPIRGFEFMESYSLLQVIIFIWIYASISEEFLTRGLIQGYLAPLIKYKIRIFNFHISVPVLVAALFFGLMHLGLLTTNTSTFTVFFVVFFAIIVGIIAGYYREKTESIIPAILIHMLFNVWSTILGS